MGDEIGDLDEADVAFEEGGHGDFVGGVQDRGRAAPGREGLASQPEAREAHRIGRFEGERSHLGQVKPLVGPGQPVRMVEGVEDGNTHVGHPELSGRGAQPHLAATADGDG